MSDEFGAAHTVEAATVGLRTLIADLASGRPPALPDHEPVPLAALPLAILVEMCARNLARELAPKARAAGASWYDIAVAAGIHATRPAGERAQAAFDWAAGPPGRHPYPYVLWRCPTCTALITDQGPHRNAWDGTEPGHLPMCTRWQAGPPDPTKAPAGR